MKTTLFLSVLLVFANLTHGQSFRIGVPLDGRGTGTLPKTPETKVLKPNQPLIPGKEESAKSLPNQSIRSILEKNIPPNLLLLENGGVRGGGRGWS